MKTFSLTFLSLLFCLVGFSQKYSSEETKHLKTNYFEIGFMTPAKKKMATVIMNDGKEVRGLFQKIKYKKNHIHFMSIKDSASGKTIDIPVVNAKEAYLVPSNMEKVNKNFDGRIKTRKSIKKLSEGESLFVVQTVGMKNKKKKDAYLLQLLNPDFDDVISVYFDPAAKESKGFDVGGMIGGSALKGALTVGGGILESYYVKKGDRIFWLNKKNLKKEYDFLFGDNQEFMTKYPYKNVNWSWISALVLEYNNLTKEKRTAGI